jgi:soluble lytic murein transglycosylase
MPDGRSSDEGPTRAARTWRLFVFAALLSALLPSATNQSPAIADAAARDSSGSAATGASPDARPLQAALLPTAHPPLPSTIDELWLVPASASAAGIAASGTTASPLLKRFAEGVDDIASDNYSTALPKVSDPRLARTPVADYAAYYTALAQLHTNHVADARDGFKALNAAQPVGVLREWALAGEAEASESLGQYADAARLYEQASMLKVSAPDRILCGLGRNLAASGDRPRALAAFRRVYFEFPLSELATAARDQVVQLSGLDENTRLRQDFALELGRAQRVFGAKRYAEALSSFEALRNLADGDNRELAGLRIAEAQFYLGRFRQAIDGTRPFLNGASRKIEARFFNLSAMRGAGDHSGYVAAARKLIEDAKANDGPWVEETLNNLGTHYILVDEDDTAIDVFREYYEKFPTGKYAQRAAWKLGWSAYREQRYGDAVPIFEQAALAFPRSDYRPPYLYWTARAYDQLGQNDAAASRYALISVDYLNSYYGRLADVQLRKRGIVAAAARRALADRPVATAMSRASTDGGSATGEGSADAAGASGSSDNASDAQANAGAVAASVSPASASGSGANQAATTAAAATHATPREVDARIRQLISAGLYTTAIAEVESARRQWETSPVLEATLAWLYQRQGDLRRGINAMKRAYPQWLTADGQRLPKEAQRVLFPIDYWTVIKRHAVARGLDPYLIAALVAQESTFTADVRSSANAYGLMQVLPSTGRQLSRSLGIKRFSTAKLTDPELNVRLGTLYFQRLVKQFGGGTHYALASYNAGENRVEQWIAERPTGMPQDEFIDDIPFPETQNYVKRILGTAEDYRRLY